MAGDADVAVALSAAVAVGKAGWAPRVGATVGGMAVAVAVGAGADRGAQAAVSNNATILELVKPIASIRWIN